MADEIIMIETEEDGVVYSRLSDVFSVRSNSGAFSVRLNGEPKLLSISQEQANQILGAMQGACEEQGPSSAFLDDAREMLKNYLVPLRPFPASSEFPS